jgi:hypothetical protein
MNLSSYQKYPQIPFQSNWNLLVARRGIPPERKSRFLSLKRRIVRWANLWIRPILNQMALLLDQIYHLQATVGEPPWDAATPIDLGGNVSHRRLDAPATAETKTVSLLVGDDQFFFPLGVTLERHLLLIQKTK